MVNWYTADLHLGHANILTICNRPFESVEQMNASYIQGLKSVVRKHDDLWILGDVSVGRSVATKSLVENLLRCVPGRKHLVKGNHDAKWNSDLGWHSVHDISEIRDGDTNLVLCHYPMRSWNRRHWGALQLFGHVHDAHRGGQDSINVGVDCWNHQPVQLRDILSRAETLPLPLPDEP